MPDAAGFIAWGETMIARHPHSRTIYGHYEAAGEGADAWFWVKQISPPNARIWHGIQKILAGILRQPILRCTVSPGGSAALAQEAGRLRDFRARGFRVPEVMALDDRMMILSDLGPQLRTCLDDMPDEPLRRGPLQAAARALAELHEAGLCHGRPYIRDMTLVEGMIGFLDLEEDPVPLMSLPVAQARDVWVFLAAVARFARKPGDKYTYETPLIAEVFEAYRGHAREDTLAELAKFVHALRPLRRLAQTKFLWPKIGNDARQAAFISGWLECGLPCDSSSSMRSKS